jgi:hypothetical protein
VALAWLTVRSAPAVRVPASEPGVPPAQPVLRWTGIDGARYRVRVLTPELELLEESAESPALEHAIGAAALQRVPPGGRIVWQVEARLPEGGTVMSPTFNARIE